MNRSAFHPSVTRNMLFRCCFRDYVALTYSEFSRLTVFGTVETVLEIPAVIRSLRLQGFCLAQLCMVALSQAHKTILQVVSSGHFIYLFAFLRIQLRAVALARSSKTTSPIADMGGDSHLTPLGVAQQSFVAFSNPVRAILEVVSTENARHSEFFVASQEALPAVVKTLKAFPQVAIGDGLSHGLSLNGRKTLEIALRESIETILKNLRARFEMALRSGTWRRKGGGEGRQKNPLPISHVNLPMFSPSTPMSYRPLITHSPRNRAALLNTTGTLAPALARIHDISYSDRLSQTTFFSYIASRYK
jgi:hypothetical protein